MSGARRIAAQILMMTKTIKRTKHHQRRIDDLSTMKMALIAKKKIVKKRIALTKMKKTKLMAKSNLNWLKFYSKGLKANKKASKMATLTKCGGPIAGQFLPIEIIANILCRLPVKSLLRIRCVCKQWRSLTYDPRFIEEQHKVSSSGSYKLIDQEYRTEEGIKIYDFGPDREIKLHAFHIKLEEEPSGHPYSIFPLSNSINGLVGTFGESRSHPYHYLLNPATREHLQLPRSGREVRVMTRGRFGLGFDASRGEYKLVKLHHEERDKKKFCICEVLTVGSHQWRYVGEVPCVVQPQPPVFLNGTLHWLATALNYNPWATVILVFDVKDETLRFIQTSSIVLDYSFVSRLSVQQFQGHVCLVEKPRISRGKRLTLTTKIWILMDYTNHEWKLEYEIDMSNWVDQTGLYRPHVIDIRGGEAFVQMNDAIYSYDLHSKTFLKLLSEKSLRCLSVITESLLSPRNFLSNLSVA